MVVGWLSIIVVCINSNFVMGTNFMSICFKILSFSQSYFLDMGKINVINMMNMSKYISVVPLM